MVQVQLFKHYLLFSPLQGMEEQVSSPLLGCHGLDLPKRQPDILTEGREGPVNALMDVLIPKERQLFTRQLYLTDK